MGSITIADIDRQTLRRLKEMAWHHGVRLDEFVRQLVIDAAIAPSVVPAKPGERAGPILKRLL
jgi:hypothetical protein